MSRYTSLGLGRVIRTSDLALLVKLEEIGEEKWIPKSVLGPDSDLTDSAEVGEFGEVEAGSRWAEEKGLS